MRQILLDTCVISHLEHHRSQMEQMLKPFSQSEAVIAFPTYIETVGALPVAQKHYLKKTLSIFPVLGFDEKAQGICRKICYRLKIAPVDRIDFIIACIAIARKLPLLTENKSDFEPFLTFGLNLVTYNLQASKKEVKASNKAR